MARHNLRGKLNALKLCVSALSVTETAEEAAQFLEMIADGSGQLIHALDELELVQGSVAAEPL